MGKCCLHFRKRVRAVGVTSVSAPLQYGSGKTLGAGANGSAPTYVYPSALKAVVRARFPGQVKDWEDPVGSQVVPSSHSLTYITPLTTDYYIICRFTKSPTVTSKEPSGLLPRHPERNIHSNLRSLFVASIIIVVFVLSLFWKNNATQVQMTEQKLTGIHYWPGVNEVRFLFSGQSR